ncbi:MAG: PLDc N-terminal domain-containing protein [Bacteroidales bacterium]
MFALFGLLQLTFFLGGLVLCILLPIAAIIDIVRSNFEGNNKLIWVIVVIAFNFLGALLYFLIGRNQKI